jgi:ATP-binding cassette, subfamily C (CFTR/MRP), member 1
MSLLVVEAVEKGRILLPSYKSGSPEATTGIYSRSLFWWLNPLFLTGHRNVLSNDTLLDIDDALATDRVYERFQKVWTRRTLRLWY